MSALSRFISPRLLHFYVFIICALAIAAALVMQYVMDLAPCPLCIFQRVAIIAVGLIFLIAAIQGPKTWGNRIYAGCGVIAAIIGGGISIRHLWIQAHPEAVFSCGPSDLGYIFGSNSFHEAVSLVLQGTADCATVHTHFLGLTIPGWTLMLFVGLLLIGLFQLFRRYA